MFLTAAWAVAFLVAKDMLHSHVLPQHVEYARLLQNARFIVLDEACKWLQSPNADPKQAGPHLSRSFRSSRLQHHSEALSMLFSIAPSVPHRCGSSGSVVSWTRLLCVSWLALQRWQIQGSALAAWLI